ncbi:hypothetical protein GE253_05420 [Niveispirillum sp. SYP-B3756]|uniref:hypothetical protein n=1 Tax=Niveispirillum sp. SYP-B3756 TaxID=2662178 RepID=UPI001291D71F|nr:hypothetical protein [Niveispirillum sp. SYP-B3756]MQP64782.1 hypothetical protein [Niveispirillum sp. SYP-B3756]
MRTLLVTLLTLVVGLPACLALAVLLLRAAGLRGDALGFAVLITGNLGWILLLFAALWQTVKEKD